jgi:hypothetical protein
MFGPVAPFIPYGKTIVAVLIMESEANLEPSQLTVIR